MTVIVNDEQVAALRAFLAGGPEEFVPLHHRLIRSDQMEGYGEFVYAAFVTATRRRFSPTYTRADIIRFVAGVRALLYEEPDIINPHAAESLIRRALGEQLTDELDMETNARAQIALLLALVQDEDLDNAELDEFLDTVRTSTGQWWADAQ
jgi:hypothetical protein